MIDSEPTSSTTSPTESSSYWVDNTLNAMGLANADWSRLVAASLASFGADERARQYAHQLKLTQALLRAALARLDVDLKERQIPYLLLKGQPLQELLFADGQVRSTGDIDLLVLPGDVEATQAILDAQGYRRKREEEPRWWALNQEPWIHPTHQTVVEIHWSLTLPSIPAPPPIEVFGRCQPFSLSDSLQVSILDPETLLIHLALHFHHHHGFAKGLVDVAGWCDRQASTVDHEALLDRCRRLGLYGLVQWPLHTLAHLCDRRPPLWRADADPLVKTWARVSSIALRHCLDREAHTPLEDSMMTMMPQIGPASNVTVEALTMLVLDGAPAKIEGVLRRFFLGPHRIGRRLQSILPV